MTLTTFLDLVHDAAMSLGRIASTLLAACVSAGCLALVPTATDATTRHFRSSDDLHIQYAGRLVVPSATRVVDVDLDATSSGTVAALHRRGKVVVCYISAGSAERYRSDAAAFPTAVIGKTLVGWPDERWLDIRQLPVLLPIMKARVERCKAKGFDAMDFDNVDAYANDSGFPLTASDQIRYDRALAALAHAAHVQAVLKNAVSIIPRLVGSFDAALNEQCGQYDECGVYGPFVRAKKPVWVLEYSVPYTKACLSVQRFGVHVQRKHLDLDAWRQACPAPRG